MKSKSFLLIIPLVVIIGAGIVLTFNQSQKPNQSSGGQPYLIYKTNDFEVKYPDWPNIDRSKIAADADKVKVAVSNAGCNFVIKEGNIPSGTTLEAYTDKVMSDYGKNLKIIKQAIHDNQAYLDAEINMSGTILKNVSMSFKTKSNSYGFAFIAEKDKFSPSCGPLVNEVIASVKAN